MVYPIVHVTPVNLPEYPREIWKCSDILGNVSTQRATLPIRDVKNRLLKIIVVNKAGKQGCSSEGNCTCPIFSTLNNLLMG